MEPRFRQQNGLAYTGTELQTEQTEARFKVAEQGLVLRVTQSHFEMPIPQDSLQFAVEYWWLLPHTA